MRSSPVPLRPLLISLGLGALLLLGGCQSYHTPGLKADLQSFASADMQAAFAAQPTNPWPASIAAVRVQGSGYQNYNVGRWNGAYEAGAYTVVTLRELDDEAALKRIGHLPSVAGVTGINRMLLPEKIETDADLRQSAARLRADLLFVYTLETSFYKGDESVPLTVISLGLSPTRRVRGLTTASALLIDTRTGFIYSTYEASREARTHATSWGSKEAADQLRQETEKEAFAALIESVAESWPALLAKHPPRPPVDGSVALHHKRW